MRVLTLVKPHDSLVKIATDRQQGIHRGDEEEIEKSILLINRTVEATMAQLLRFNIGASDVLRAFRMAAYEIDNNIYNAIIDLRCYTDSYTRSQLSVKTEAFRASMVEANALRLQRICYQRTHRRQDPLRFHHPVADLANVQFPSSPAGLRIQHFFSSVPLKATDIVGRVRMPDRLPPVPTTTALQTDVQAMIDELITGAPRANFTPVGNGLIFPPVPSTDQCPYCGVLLEFSGSMEPLRWK